MVKDKESILERAIKIAKDGKTVSIVTKESPSAVKYLVKFREHSCSEEEVRRIRINKVSMESGRLKIGGILGAEVCLVEKELDDLKLFTEISSILEKSGCKEIVLH